MTNNQQKEVTRFAVKSLSIFFPAYNEKDAIPETVAKSQKVLDKLGIPYELLIIDDGSTDGTAEVVDNLAAKDKRIRVIHQKNGGYGMALRAGFYNSKNEWVIYTDSDGQFDFSEVNKFLELAGEADVIWGYRIKRNDPFYRLLFALGWKLSIFSLFGFFLRDIDCGFKAVKKKVFDTIPKLESTRGGMINAELAFKAKKHGFKIAQVGVNHYARSSGTPTGANIGVIIQSYIDLIKLRLKTF